MHNPFWMFGGSAPARVIGLMTLTLCTIAAAPGANGQEADAIGISTMRYENQGAYRACLHIDWRSELGVHRRSHGVDCMTAGESVTWNLESVRNASGRAIAEGEEVWGVVAITGSGMRKCRDGGRKFFYHPDGGEVVYTTAGTALSNNRCRIVESSP